MSGALEARGLVKRFASVAVLSGIDLCVRPGEVLGYLGPNGSGKSVTARLLTGLLEPTEGTITFDGRRIDDDLSSYRRRLGYVPEEPQAYSFLSGREHLQLVGRLRALPPDLLEHKIDRLFTLFDLGRSADQPMAAYSKGMRQKVMISAALLHNPDLLIFDEPESGLDVATTLVLPHLVRQLASRGKAVIYSSHLLEIVEHVATRVILLHRGRVVADDSVDHLRHLAARQSLEEVVATMLLENDPEASARDIVDVATLGT